MDCDRVIKEMMRDPRVKVRIIGYDTSACPFSNRAVSHCQHKGIPYQHHVIQRGEEAQRWKDFVAQRSTRRIDTFPMVFVGERGDYIGGSDELLKMMS